MVSVTFCHIISVTFAIKSLLQSLVQHFVTLSFGNWHDVRFDGTLPQRNSNLTIYCLWKLTWCQIWRRIVVMNSDLTIHCLLETDMITDLTMHCRKEIPSWQFIVFWKLTWCQVWRHIVIKKFKVDNSLSFGTDLVSDLMAHCRKEVPSWRFIVFWKLT